MDENLDLVKFMKICGIIMAYSNTKTLSSRTFQSAIQILYIDNFELTQRSIFNAHKYYFEQDNNQDILSFNHYNNLIRNFIDLDGINIFGYKPRLDSNSIKYFCGLADTINNRVQQFNN